MVSVTGLLIQLLVILVLTMTKQLYYASLVKLAVINVQAIRLVINIVHLNVIHVHYHLLIAQVVLNHMFFNMECVLVKLLLVMMEHILIVQLMIVKYAQLQVAINVLVMNNATKNVWIIANRVIIAHKSVMNVFYRTLCHKDSVKFKLNLV